MLRSLTDPPMPGSDVLLSWYFIGVRAAANARGGGPG